jgi:hypothetical protein
MSDDETKSAISNLRGQDLRKAGVRAHPAGSPSSVSVRVRGVRSRQARSSCEQAQSATMVSISNTPHDDNTTEQ